MISMLSSSTAAAGLRPRREQARGMIAAPAADEQSGKQRPSIERAREPVGHDGCARVLLTPRHAPEACRGVDSHCSLRRAEGLRRARRRRRRRVLLEQLDQLVGHGAGELGGVGDGDGAAVVARHVVADADGDQLDRGARLDLLDHLAQMPLQVAAGVHRQRRIVDRRAVRDHHQDAPLLGPPLQASVRPGQRLAVDVLLEQALAHHQGERALGAPPGRIRRLVDDVAQIVEAARDCRACRRRARPRAPVRPSRHGW